MRICIAAWTLSLACGAAAQTVESERWAAEASRVTIARDDWGIAHVHGKGDADAVFGMIYAQCEDDFNRVERNYLTALGRTAEADGEGAIWADLRQRLFIDPEDLKKKYARSPEWLRELMNAWADGINFYLATHRQVKPKVLTRFEPWMALSFTEGSIGGDIEKVDLKKLEEFYGGRSVQTAAMTLPETEPETEPRGSNGFAIAPANTRDGHALLLINPHTSFFFRSELQMTSDEGMNAYGAVTWGQFFVYQGFNERAGWMHTSSNVDAVDEYRESTEQNLVGCTDCGYRYRGINRHYDTKEIKLSYLTPAKMKQRSFTAYTTVHGPVVRLDGGHPVTVKLMNLPVQALEQSYLRTKARSYAEFLKTMELRANSSNNTVFADGDGDIAYWHGDYIPKRDARFDYTKPVDGSNEDSEWKGLMTVDEIPHLKNPTSGYLFNVNYSPWNGAGASSLKKTHFPPYVEQGMETARGVHAMRVLAPGGVTKKDWTLDSLVDAAYDSYLPWFARTVPGLVAAWNGLGEDDPERAKLAAQIALLRGWDERWGADSAATLLAVYWGTELMRHYGAAAQAAVVASEEYVAANAPGRVLLAALATATDKLTADFGRWQVPWGEINRFQRLTGDIQQPFSDAAPSLPVPFTSSLWGSLAAFGARQYPGTKKWYGTMGNSFVAVVEFGPTVRALAVTAGGESGNPKSKHFDDEAGRYAAGRLREVYFYPEELVGHTERTYKPGQ